MELQSPEIEALLSICRAGSSDHLAKMSARQMESIDWKLLIEIACLQGVEGLTCKAITELPSEQVPENITAAAQAYIEQCTEQNQNRADQLSYILSELLERGIPAIPFKGPTLAIKAYGDLDLRAFSDLDFLVKHEQIEQTIKALKEIGYAHDRTLTPRQWRSFVDYAGQDMLFGPGVPIEPHWEFSPRTWSLNLDYPELWHRATSFSFNGETVLSLSAEDEFMLLCVHGNKEQWRKLKWVVDVAWFLKSNSVDWKVIIDRSTQQGVARMVRVAVILANRLVGFSMPEQLISWVDQDPFAKTMGEQLSIEFFEKDRTQDTIYSLSSVHWNMRERYSDRWRYLYRTITQPRERHFQDIALPDELFFLYYPYKLLHDYLALPIWLGLKKIGLVKRDGANQERV